MSSALLVRRKSKVSGNYASGISVPVRPDGDGGLALSEGDAYIRTQVLACVSPNESDNPFQDLGGDQMPIFQNPADPSWRQAFRRRLARQFTYLEDENLARLEAVEFQGVLAPEGDYGVLVKYINLETGTSADVRASLTGASGAGTAAQAGGR